MRSMLVTVARPLLPAATKSLVSIATIVSVSCFVYSLCSQSGVAAAALSATEETGTGINASSEWACSAASGRVARLSSVSSAMEYVAGSLMPYSRGALAIDGVPGLHPVTGPDQLAITAANSSSFSSHLLLLNLTDQRCLCNFNTSEYLGECFDFALPEPPRPEMDTCHWHLSSGGLLMETDGTDTRLSCLDRRTMSVNNPDLFWPKQPSVSGSLGSANTLFIKYSYTVVQYFNGSRYVSFLADAIINSLWPVRISLVRQETTLLEGGVTARVLIYRRYFGWSRHCLHECRAVYRPGSSFQTLKQTCRDLDSPLPEMPSAENSPPGCMWIFTVSCHPVLARIDNQSLACELVEDFSQSTAQSSFSSSTASSATPTSNRAVTSTPTTSTTPTFDEWLENVTMTTTSTDSTNGTQSYITMRLVGSGLALSAPAVKFELTAMCFLMLPMLMKLLSM